MKITNTHFRKYLFVVSATLILALALSGISSAIAEISNPQSVSYSIQPSAATMQQFTAVDCESMHTYTTQILVDARGNNQSYRIRKMPDGRCWMVDNLKLAGYTLTSADSDVTANFEIPVDPVQNDSTRNNGVCVGGIITSDGTSHNLTCDGTTTTPMDGNEQFIAYSDPSLGGSHHNCNSQTAAHRYSAGSLTDCGYLYNWYTATAGTGTFAAQSASASICPKGWKLPLSSSYFTALNNAMAAGSTTSLAPVDVALLNWMPNGAFESVFAGAYGTAFSNRGAAVSYWSSRGSGDSVNTNVLAISASSVDFSYIPTYRQNYYGNAVRCVL